MAPSLPRIVRLCRKELRETLRDRRTIITLLLMPLLIYPLLSMTLNRFLLTSASGDADSETVFIVDSLRESDLEFLQLLLEDPRSSPPQSIIAAAGDAAPAKFASPTDRDGSALEHLRAGRLDVVVALAGDETPELTFFANAGSERSQQARRILIERVQWYNASVMQQQLQQVRGQMVLPAVRIEVETIVGEAETQLLATMIPLILVLMTITGAVYPAIDLTAGERERGTIEAVMASPVSRSSILVAKYCAVVTVAMLTAIVNLAAMFITLRLGGLLPLLLGPDALFPWFQILQILGLLVLFSGFFSAILLALTSFARSFKEAQAYLIPLMLLSLGPGILSLLPGISLAGPLAVTPLINIVLLTREVLTGEAAVGPAIAAILSTLVYSAAGISIAARLFGSDAVLRGSEFSVRSFFSRPEKPQAVPTVTAAMLTLAILFPLYFTISNLLQEYAPEAMSDRLRLNAGSLLLLFGGLPAVVAWLSRNAWQSTFRLYRPRIGSLIGAVLMGLGLWAFAFEAVLWAKTIGIGSLDAGTVAAASEAKSRLQELSPWLLLAVFALAPGVIEEWCFRGFLFSALLPRLHPWQAIGGAALMFGLFHMLTGSVLHIERLLPSTFIGFFLGWTVWRSGSIFPAMALHFTHDALLLLIMRYESKLQASGWDIDNASHLPVTLLVMAMLLVLAGIAMVHWSTKAAN